MSRFNTGNPIDSDKLEDLSDNAKNLDQAVNAEQDTFQDRLGKSRLTWTGIEKAGTGEPGEIVTIVQQAVQDVVVGVDGQVAVAESAADRAETAAVSALAAGNRFNTTTQGLAATVDGQYFLLNTGDPQVFDVYLNDNGTAVASGQFKVSDGSEAFELVRSQQLSLQLPNLLSAAEVSSSTPPSVTGSTVSRVNLGGAYASSITTTVGPARCVWSKSADEFPSGSISAYVLLVSRNAGPSGTARIIQRDGGGTQLDRTDIAVGLSEASTTPTEIKGTTSVVAGAVTVELDVQLYGEGRNFVVQSPMLADGQFNGFRLPKDVTKDFFNSLNAEGTGVEVITFDMPLTAIPTVGITPVLSTAVADDDKAYSISAFVAQGSSDIAAFKLGAGLTTNEIIRLELTCQRAINTPTFGLLFGNEEALRGFGLRSTAQLLTLNWPASYENETGPAARPYSDGDRLVMDARLIGGSPGNYTVRYFVEYPDGYRVGPYDIGGIDSVDEVWLGSRSRSDWGDIVVTRHSVPVYFSEWDSSSQPSAATSIVYVSSTGDDSGTGGESSPFLTINKAISSLPNGGIVEVSGGEYRETITHNSPNSIWIRSRRGERAVVLGSDKLDVSKTTGYSQVYQAPLADKPVGIGGGRGEPVIFEWGTPSKPIPAEERHALQRGRSHRLPYTEMFEAESLAELDTVDGLGKWWWDDGVIYFAATDGSDARTKRYEARVRPLVAQLGGSLRLSRMTLLFSSHYGAQFRGSATLTEDVVVLGSHHNGFAFQSGIWKSYRDEAGGNGNDGFNGTVSDLSGADDSISRITAFIYDGYGHDNGDDGTSFHYRGDATYYGGLFEYNSKADVVHVTGAAVTCYGTVARGSNNGFYTSTTPDGDSSREFTAMRCVGTKAYDNQYAYRARHDSVLECDNAVAVNPSVFGYAQSGEGVLVARNSKYTGDPAKMKDGNVEVINDGALT